MKYKVGDKVRIRKDLKKGNRYDGCFFNQNMAKYCGKVVTVEVVSKVTERYAMKECGYWSWNDAMLEEVDEMNITITAFGDLVTAQMDDKYGAARCSPEDKFDIFVGAKLALERLEKQCKPYAWLKYSAPYYIPSASEEGLCRTRYYNNDAIDDRMKERGLVFKTEEEAIEAAKKMLAVVKES